MPLARPFSKGLLMVRIHSLFLSFRLGESILRLWRGPSPRAYSWSGFTLFSFHSALGIHPVPLTRPFSQSQPSTPQKEKSQLSLTLFRDRVSSREADIGHCFFLPPR